MSRGRTTNRFSFNAGELTLPGVRALLCVAMLLAACAPAAVPAAATPSGAAPTGVVPTLGTKPPAGLLLPTYFLTVIASANGSLSVLTSPESVCQLAVRAPSGATLEAGPRTADATGTAAWTYPPIAETGEAIATATCHLGDQKQAASAQVKIP